MSENLKSNLEILSKIVIQLKTEQKENIKYLKSEIEELKELNVSLSKKAKEQNESEILNIKNEMTELKKTIKFLEEKNQENIREFQAKLDKTDKDLREDMLRLLKKYESKFQIQDEEIENLKEKCEMDKCANCEFESFKIHFKDCPICNNCVCLNCLKNCLKCDLIKCAKCLCECNTCLELFCSEENPIKEKNNYLEQNKLEVFNKNLINNKKEFNPYKTCINKCKLCLEFFCGKCNASCKLCSERFCKKCLKECRGCKNFICKNCFKKCVKCSNTILCFTCLDKNIENEKCICGRILCFECEDECSDCNIPITWTNNNRIFQGFHIRSMDFLPNKSLIKLLIVNKGIDTTHIGLTIDSELSSHEKATENFWSLCLNTGEKFSTSEYKKKGTLWTNYAVPVKTGDIIYIRFYEGEVRFLINRKDYNKAFLLDAKNYKYFLYCLTHNDSTKVEIKSMRILNTPKNIDNNMYNNEK